MRSIKCIYFTVILFIVLHSIALCQAREYKMLEIEILPVTNQKWTFDEIRLNQSKNFTNYDTTTQSSKTEDVKFWIKFKYKQGSQAHNNILFNHHIWYKKVELYYLIGDSLIYQVSGNMIPIHKKTLVDPSSLFMLPNTTDTIQCYLYLESNCGYQFISTVNNLNERILENFNLNFREAFFYGITILSMIFSLSFLIFVREKFYFYYLLFGLILLLSRTLEYGILYTVLPFNSIFLKSQALISIYSFIFPALTIILFLYINAFLHLSANNPKISKLIIRLAFLRFFIWLLSLLFFETSFRSVFNSNYIDIVYTTFLIVIIITSIKDNWRLASIALVDIFIVYMGLISDVYLSLFDFSYDNNYDIFLFFSTIEVVVFSISIAYRYNLLKKENEKSLTLLIGQLRKNEELKDNINKELEIKVKERTWQLQQKTEEIARINQQLKSFNVELKHEVEDVTQARIFHKNMDFNEFKSIFKDEITCHKYLSELKWNEKKMYACCKCGYSNFKILENYSRKCRKCNHIESPTSGTLYNKVKFPLYKAFYITYLVSMQAKETVEEVSTILDLRVGTVGAFRQKVLAIIEKNKLKKQHNDGWTHLII